MTTVGSTAVTFDSDGNTLTDQAGRHFTWDSENRMTSCTLANSQDTTFTYGADGLRRSMTVTQSGSSLTTCYVYDGTMMIREMQVNTGQFANVGVGQLLPSATYFQGGSGPAYRRNDLNGSIPRWYVYNGLGSVVGEVDPAGNYTASQEYDIYGNVRQSTQTGTFDTRQGYVGGLGHQTDPETGGLIYMQARYYDPSTGRFCSEDKDGDGFNWYIYCFDNPISHVDADGRQAGPTGVFPVLILIDLVTTIYENIFHQTPPPWLNHVLILVNTVPALYTIFCWFMDQVIATQVVCLAGELAQPWQSVGYAMLANLTIFVLFAITIYEVSCILCDTAGDDSPNAPFTAG